MKPPTPEQHPTEIQQKLAELKRIQEEIDREEEKIERENDELQEARKREYELTTDPTFWDKHGWWIKVLGICAVGLLIIAITDGEFFDYENMEPGW